MSLKTWIGRVRGIEALPHVCGFLELTGFFERVCLAGNGAGGIQGVQFLAIVRFVRIAGSGFFKGSNATIDIGRFAEDSLYILLVFDGDLTFAFGGLSLEGQESGVLREALQIVGGEGARTSQVTGGGFRASLAQVEQMLAGVNGGAVGFAIGGMGLGEF